MLIDVKTCSVFHAVFLDRKGVIKTNKTARIRAKP